MKKLLLSVLGLACSSTLTTYSLIVQQMLTHSITYHDTETGIRATHITEGRKKGTYQACLYIKQKLEDDFTEDAIEAQKSELDGKKTYLELEEQYKLQQAAAQTTSLPTKTEKKEQKSSSFLPFAIENDEVEK